MAKSDRQKQWKGLVVLGIIWVVGAVCDRIWFAIDRSVPAWDQAEYLRGTLNYWQAFQNPRWFDGEWWTSFWQLSTKVPPFTYIVAGIVQNIVSAGPDQATIVNLFFSAILLASVYGLGIELFSVEVGLWAAAICQLLPGLYRFRLDFLLDYPLTAIVTLSFYCLTGWRNSRTAEAQRTQRKEWLWAAAFGVFFGIALLVKQTAIFFLLMPLLWVGVGEVRHLIKSFRLRNKLGKSQLFYSLARVSQLAGALLLSILIFGPWYRINWLLILTSGKRATVDSAIAEGDPALNTIDAWTFYWKDLPYVISWLLLLVPIVGFLIYFANSLINKSSLEVNFAKSSIKWLAIFWISSYLLCSLNINKDTRYVMPYLPLFALFLAYGLTLWKGRWAKHIRWGTIGLATLLMLLNIYPLGGSWLTQFLSPRFQHYAYMGDGWPHRNVIAEIIKTEPYLRSNLGVLPSTPDINQHNLNYYGSLNNFQVHGRQVGTRNKFVYQDARSLSWFVTKTGDQGSIPSEAQFKIVQTVEQGGDFKLQKSWVLPDKTTLNLYHSRIPPVTVKPLKETIEKVRLNQVKIPDKSPPGLPIPVTYSWSGTWKELKSGLILLTWKNVCSEGFSPQCQEEGLKSSLQTKPQRWLHDRAIAMGNLHPGQNTSLDDEIFEVIERTAMLPPANIQPGIYTLQATFLNRETGEAYPISVPPIKLNIDPKAKPTPAPELDLITQLRNLAAKLPEGRKGLEPVFDEVGRINMYDPIQDYLVQADRILDYRLQQEPQNVEWAYAFALAKVLQKDVKGAIAALERVTELDSQNPYAYAYLAFVHLYNWHPKPAEEALKPALALNPNIQELQALNGVAALMQGNVVKAWQILQQLKIQID